MKIETSSDLERYDLALLALMVAEEIYQQPLIHQGLAQLATLRRELICNLEPMCSEQHKFEHLLRVFYQQFGFACHWNNYFITDNNLLHRVLETRLGNSLLLGILLLYLAKSVKINAEGISFPDTFFVRLNVDDQPFIIDPLNGQVMNNTDLERRLRGGAGNHMRLEPQHLETSSHNTIIERLLAQLKTSLIREERVLEALRCCELMLRINPGDPYEIRDRGFLYERLDCEQQALNDFEYFIRQCPNDPVALILKQQLAKQKIRPNTLH